MLGILPAMSPKEVSDRLKLDTIAKNHTWKVEPSCATTGEGIFEGLVGFQPWNVFRRYRYSTD